MTLAILSVLLLINLQPAFALQDHWAGWWATDSGGTKILAKGNFGHIMPFKRDYTIGSLKTASSYISAEHSSGSFWMRTGYYKGVGPVGGGDGLCQDRYFDFTPFGQFKDANIPTQGCNNFAETLPLNVSKQYEINSAFQGNNVWRWTAFYQALPVIQHDFTGVEFMWAGSFGRVTDNSTPVSSLFSKTNGLQYLLASGWVNWSNHVVDWSSPQYYFTYQESANAVWVCGPQGVSNPNPDCPQQ